MKQNMGQIDDNFTIKSDGTIVRNPNVKKLKEQIAARNNEPSINSNRKSSNSNGKWVPQNRLKGQDEDKRETRAQKIGCMGTIVEFIVIIFTFSVIFGILGFFFGSGGVLSYFLLGGIFAGTSYIYQSFISED